ncbi:DUF3533 domain-containing protein [Streptomyces sp. NPDC058045]|uniref:DUF3533 domain-containing protein n=1 Tax=Streptomyces sp. NPDC058045 TaxID=3346311 RepID=UPI0036E1F1DE
MAQSADAPRVTFLSELRSAVTPRAGLLVLGVLVLQLLFIASYVGALHEPKPQDVPFGVVAPPARVDRAVAELDRLSDDPLAPRAVGSAQEARRKIIERELDGALIIDPDRPADTLLVASGGGNSLATALKTLGAEIERSQQRSLRVVDVAPASAHDFSGLSSFYLVVGWCVGGYLCASILAVSAGTSRASTVQRAALRLLTMAVYAILGGLLGTLIAGPILGALPGSVWGLWGLGTLVVFAVGAATLALQALTGVIGIGIAVLLVVIAGNPSAGGALALPLLPPFWRAIGPALPPGAGTWAARSIAYFEGNALLGPLLVLSAWAVLGTAVTLAMSAWRGAHRPARPAPARPAT